MYCTQGFITSNIVARPTNWISFGLQVTNEHTPVHYESVFEVVRLAWIFKS